MSLSDRDLIDFVYAEARLLDELRFEDWLELYADDGSRSTSSTTASRT